MYDEATTVRRVVCYRGNHGHTAPLPEGIHTPVDDTRGQIPHDRRVGVRLELGS
jgi:hypothetical protein